MIKVLLGLILSAVFGIISYGAFIDARPQALPLAILFAALSIYSAVVAIRTLINSRSK